MLTLLAEYIGQLEGEVAVKVQEANDLRTQNQQLREENNRLTDLTRMLLSSQAFSGFLQELSQSGLPASSIQSMAQQAKAPQNQPQAQSSQKDVSSRDAGHQMHVQQPQIGMALIPETHMDFAAFQPSNAWMTALPGNDFQVYSVTEMPEPPTLDLEILTGKNKSSSSIFKPTKDIPQLAESAPQAVSEAEHPTSVQVDESVELDQAAFALYFDSSASASSDSEEPLNSAMDDEPVSDEVNLARLERMCSELDAACSRLADYTRHME